MRSQSGASAKGSERACRQSTRRVSESCCQGVPKPIEVERMNVDLSAVGESLENLQNVCGRHPAPPVSGAGFSTGRPTS
jgi:hypothetical protein